MNIRKLGFLGALFIIASCSTTSKLNLGSTMNGDFTNNTDKIIIPSGALIPSKKIDIKNTSYILGISNNEIIYVSTTNNNLQIEGYKVGNLIDRKFSNAKLIIGWGYYIKLNEDWYAGFDFKNKPTKDSKIEWMFKYNFSPPKKIW